MFPLLSNHSIWFKLIKKGIICKQIFNFVEMNTQNAVESRRSVDEGIEPSRLCVHAKPPRDLVNGTKIKESNLTKPTRLSTCLQI